MKNVIIILFTLSLIACTGKYVKSNSNTPAATKKSSWDRYKRTTMEQISHTHFIFSDSSTVNYVLFGVELPYKVRLIYKKDSRKLSMFKKELIHYYFIMKRINPEYEKLFETEVLFAEGDKTYWIAVQKPLDQELKYYCKPGDTVDVYINCIGVILDSLNTEGIYLLNRFDEL